MPSTAVIRKGTIMPRKIENPSGRLTIRVPVEVHAELARIAETMGIEVNALLNMMIREQLGPYQEKVRQLQYAGVRPDLAPWFHIVHEFTGAADQVPPERRRRLMDEIADGMRKQKMYPEHDINMALALAKTTVPETKKGK